MDTSRVVIGRNNVKTNRFLAERLSDHLKKHLKNVILVSLAHQHEIIKPGEINSKKTKHQLICFFPSQRDNLIYKLD